MKNELYLGSMSPKVTEEDIINLFKLVGTVTSIHLIRDAISGDFKGCGYVRMATIAQAKDAIETLDGALLIDKVITVSEARPNPQLHRRPQAKGRRPAGPGGTGSSRPPKGKK